MLKKSLKSFKYALMGVKILWKEENNFRIDIIFTIITISLAFFFNFSILEFILIIFVITFVLTAEALNTAIEELCDKINPDHDSHIAKIKDIAAAAVLLAAFGAFIIGLIVFIPHVTGMIN